MILLRVFSICVPLSGAIFNPIFALLIVVCSLLFKGNTALYNITLGIPTIIATLCWISETKTTRFARFAQVIFNVVLPIACIIAFSAHQTGRQAFPYALYWLLPPGIFAIKFLNKIHQRNPPSLIKIISTALRITFITHAVGSILWLYTVTTIPTYWLTLIPIVALERLGLACATTGVIVVIKILEHIILKVTAKT